MKTWRDLAACRGIDPEMFFPGRGEQVSAAQDACERCPVAFQCLVVALANNEKVGIWGGATAKSRRSLRRRLSPAAMEALVEMARVGGDYRDAYLQWGYSRLAA